MKVVTTKRSHRSSLPRLKTVRCPSRSKEYVVKDAAKRLTFSVTRADMRGSRVGDPHECAGACAIRRTTGAADVWVRRSVTYISYPGEYDKQKRKIAWRYTNPRLLMAAVEKFDKTAGYFPEGNYTIIPVSRSWTVAYMRRYNRRRSTSRTKGKIKHRSRPAFYLR